MNYVVIMAGGVGSRFWPSSRSQCPKQFLDVLGIGKSLLQMTYQRFRQIIPNECILVVTNAMYRELVQKQLPEIPAANILCEPSRNNTAPCIAYAAFHLYARNPDAAFVVAPSDHLILKEEVFLSKIKQGLDFVRQQSVLLTLGIQPHSPNTGYGYIHYQNSNNNAFCKVLQFTEKPDLARATQFLQSGNYLWNAGIFIWTVKDILASFEQYAPDIHQLFAEGLGVYNTAKESEFINANYPKNPDISIDYAILEKANNVFTSPADIGWSDLGTWASLYEQLPHDAQQNAIVNNGTADKIWCLDSEHCLVRVPKDKMVVIKDLHDYIVVDEQDALLIYPKNKEQEIKQVVQRIAKTFGDSLL